MDIGLQVVNFKTKFKSIENLILFEKVCRTLEVHLLKIGITYLENNFKFIFILFQKRSNKTDKTRQFFMVPSLYDQSKSQQSDKTFFIYKSP